MFWTRVMAVAMATLMIGAMSLAQDAPKAKEEGKTAADGDKAEAPEVDPNKAPEGKLKVATSDEITLKDEARKKDVSLTAIYPEEAGKYPVIIFSHGAGAQADAGKNLGQYWASHGFVVLIPKHNDARKSMAETMLENYDKDGDGKISKEEAPEQMGAFFDQLDTDGDGFLSKEEMAAMGNRGGGRGNRGNRNPGGEQPEKPKEEPKDGEDDFDMLGDPREILLEDPAEPAPPAPGRGQGRGQGRGGRGGFGRAPAPLDATAGVDRVADIRLLLDNVTAIVKAVPALKDKMDLEHVGVSGHNHGAYTAELIGGATVNVESTVKAEDGTETKTIENRNLADTRVKAILELSPAGADQGGLTKESFKGIKIPAMSMTGSNDSTGEGQEAAWKKQAYELAPEGGKYHVFIDGARNNSFTSEPRAWGRGGQQPVTDNTFEWVKTSTLKFWNATLKADADAKKWLEGDTLKTTSEGKATIEHK